MPLDTHTRTAEAAKSALMAQRDETKAVHHTRFFKTGPGQYGEGDRFLGVTVPGIRGIARTCDLPLLEIERLLVSEWHEARLLALLLMVRAVRKKGADCEAYYASYLAHTRYINNWDLVDSSAEYVVGAYLQTRSRTPLTKLANSKSLWERRIAMLATFHFIKAGESEDALRLAEILLQDTHDLMHKAVGWMLREVGKRCDPQILREFLEQHAAMMPRTTLRYAIEHFTPTERAHFLNLPRHAK